MGVLVVGVLVVGGVGMHVRTKGWPPSFLPLDVLCPGVVWGYWDHVARMFMQCFTVPHMLGGLAHQTWTLVLGS